MKATGESVTRMKDRVPSLIKEKYIIYEGQGPFSYQGEIYNLFAKVHICWLGNMTTYKTLFQRKRKSKH